MKTSIFEDQTAKALKKWQQTAKERKKQRKLGASAATNNTNSNMGGSFLSPESTPSRGTSPLYLLHKFHRSDNAAADQSESIPNSPRTYNSDTDLSDFEASNYGRHDFTSPEDDRAPHRNGQSFN